MTSLAVEVILMKLIDEKKVYHCTYFKKVFFYKATFINIIFNLEL